MLDSRHDENESLLLLVKASHRNCSRNTSLLACENVCGHEHGQHDIKMHIFSFSGHFSHLLCLNCTFCVNGV